MLSDTETWDVKTSDDNVDEDRRTRSTLLMLMESRDTWTIPQRWYETGLRHTSLH